MFLPRGQEPGLQGGPWPPHLFPEGRGREGGRGKEEGEKGGEAKRRGRGERQGGGGEGGGEARGRRGREGGEARGRGRARTNTLEVTSRACSVTSAVSDPVDCSLPGHFAHGILQARILEWLPFPSPEESSQSRD